MIIDFRDVLNTASSIARFGEVVGGMQSELSLLEYIRSFVEESSDEVVLEPVPVTTWTEDYCYVEVEGKTYRCAIQPPYSGSIDIEFREGETIFLNHDKVLSRELPEKKIYGKVVVVNTPRDPDDIATIAAILSTRNPRLLILSDTSETIRRIVVLNKLVAMYENAESLDIPTIVLPGSVVRRVLAASASRVLGSSHTFKSHGYNLLARRHSGGGNVILVAHHDHWLTGASDNVLGVALAINLYRRCLERFLKNTDISLALFTAEEGFPETLNSFYWLVGSRHFVAKHYDKLIEELLAAVNIDVVYGENARISTSNPILMSVLRDLNTIENDSIVFDSFSFTQAGLPSLTLHSFQEAITRGIYHSELDVLESISINTIEVFTEKAVQILKKIAEYRDRYVLRDVESVLSNEIVRQGGVNLDVAESLYSFFEELRKCSEYSVWSIFKVFTRVSTRTFVNSDIGNKFGVREFTAFLQCFSNTFNIPVNGLRNAVECYESYKFNIDLLKYIVCEVCKCGHGETSG